MRLIQLLSFPLKHTLVTYGCHKSPKLTISIYRPRCATTNYGGEKPAQLYVDNIVKLHGVPSRIVSDRGTQFTFKFWKSLHKAMGTKLDFSSAYHPQTDGQTEKVNQIIEDMLRACVLTYGKDWE